MAGKGSEQTYFRRLGIVVGREGKWSKGNIRLKGQGKKMAGKVLKQTCFAELGGVKGNGARRITWELSVITRAYCRGYDGVSNTNRVVMALAVCHRGLGLCS